MSDSEDDMPMIARRRPAGNDAAPAAAKPTSAHHSHEEGKADNPQAAVPAPKPEPVVKQEDKREPEKPAVDAAAPAAAPKPAPAKAAADSDSDDDEDDVPIAARAKPAGGWHNQNTHDPNSTSAGLLTFISAVQVVSALNRQQQRL